MKRFSQTQISLPVEGLNETLARLNAVTHVHRCRLFSVIHLGDEEVKKPRF